MKSTSNPPIKRIIIALHRDLGYFFAGIVLIYAISGLLMNNRNSINPNYSVEITDLSLPTGFASDASQITDKSVDELAEMVGESDNLIKHFYVKGNLKLLFKGGSSLVADLENQTATYEKVSRRFIISDMVRLHYNPGSWWSLFSDIFAISLIIITLTGLFIIKGRHGLIGRGGLLLLAGILVPIIFLILS